MPDRLPPEAQAALDKFRAAQHGTPAREALENLRRVATISPLSDYADAELLAELARRLRPRKCEECGKYPADWPSRLCPGCEAYQEHQR